MGLFDSVTKYLGMSSVPPAIPVQNVGAAGLTPDYLSFRNTYWGQAQPVNYRMLWKIYTEDPVVAGCVNTLVDAIVGDGFTLKIKDAEKFPTEEKNKKQLIMDKFLQKNRFNSKLRDAVTSLIIYGDAYFELVRAGFNQPKVVITVDRPSDNDAPTEDEKIRRAVLGNTLIKDFDLQQYEFNHYQVAIQRLDLLEKVNEAYGGAGETYSKVNAAANGVGKILEFYSRDAATVRIDFNEHGDVIKYIQRVLHRRVDYYPDEMIHFRINEVGGRIYGHSSLLSLVYTMQTKFSAEGYTYDFFRRGSMPRLLYIAKNFSDEQVKRLSEKLQIVKPQQDIILTGEMEVKDIAPKNSDMQFRELLDYLRDNVFAALQVPKALVLGGGGGGTGGNRSQSQTQLEMFDRRKRSLKRAIADILNNDFFSIENFGFEIEFQFNDDNSREELKKAQQGQLMSSIPHVHPNEIREVMGLPPLKDDELKALSDLKQSFEPPKPFDNRDPNSANPNKKPERVENREAQNVDQQMENKSFKKSEDVAEAEVREEQGAISRRKEVYEPANQAIARATGRERTRYPFGAQANLPEPSHEEMKQQYLTRLHEILEAAFNPVTNAFDLNHDRVYPKDGNPNPQEGEQPLVKPRPEEGPERDEVNAQGQKIWAASDKSTTATFYKGTDQLEEMEKMKKVREAKKQK